MKKIFFLFLYLGMFTACLGNGGFTIKGTAPGMDGTTVLLIARGMNNQWDTLGRTVVVAEKFRLEGKVARPIVALIQIPGKKQGLPLYLENIPFQVALDKEDLEASKVVGGKLQGLSNDFQGLKAEIYKDMPEIEKAFKKAREAGDEMTCRHLWAKSDQLDSLYNDAEYQFLKKHGNTLVAVYLVFKRNPNMKFEKLKPMYDLLSDEMKNTPYGEIITRRYKDAKITAIGEIAPDFTLLTPEGDSLSLHSIKAKVKILDFWASWCGPCRAENPNVVALYEKYKDQGLEIISVSLDTKKDAWTKAIQEDGLNWKHVSDLKGWNSAAGQLYKINSVPSIFLLDENNRIMGSNLRGERLEEFVQNALK